jgi:hypothetical protein
LFERALSFHPKVVVVGLFVGNDLYDAYDMTYHNDRWVGLRDPGFRDPRESLVDADVRGQILAGATKDTAAFALFRFREWLRNHIRLYALLGDVTRDLRVWIGLAKSDIEKARALSEVDPMLALPLDSPEEQSTVLAPSYRGDALDLGATTTAEGWRITKLLFSAMSDRAKEEGVAMAILVVPTKEMVISEWQRTQGDGIPEVMRGIIGKESQVNEAIFAFCEVEKILCVDPLPEMVQAFGGKDRMFPPVLDGHPYAPGYHAEAEAVYGLLAHLEILPLQYTHAPMD